MDLLERRFMGFRGLNLSYEVREGIWKQRDTPTARALGYGDAFGPKRSPLLEAQVADMVDSIAYDHHDLDDALKSGLLTPDDLRGIELWDAACEAVERSYAEAGEGPCGGSGPPVRRHGRRPRGTRRRNPAWRGSPEHPWGGYRPVCRLRSRLASDWYWSFRSSRHFPEMCQPE